VSLTRASFLHPRPILAAALVFVLLSPLYLRGLRVDTDFHRTIPIQDRTLQAFRENRMRFGETNPLVIRLSYSGVDREIVNRFTEELAQRLKRWQDVRFVRYRVFDPADVSDSAMRVRAALVNGREGVVEDLVSRLEGRSLRRQLMRIRKRLALADDPSLWELLAADVLGLGELLGPFVHRQGFRLARAGSSSYFDAPQSAVRIVVVQPTGSAQDSSFCENLVERVDELLQTLQGEIKGAERIGFGLTGFHAFTGESSGILQTEMARITLVASLLLFVLVWVTFRYLRVALMCFVPLVVSLFGVLLIARLFFNPIYYLTIGFAAIVIGLGLDVGLHLTARFFQIWDCNPREALERTVLDCGPALIIGVGSTAAGFVSLAYADTPGLAQFGILTSCGLVLALLSTLVLFPAMVAVLIPPDHPGVTSVGKPITVRIRWMPTAVFRWIAARPFSAAGIGIVLWAVVAPAAAGFSFETKLSHLFPSRLPSFGVAKEVAQDFQTSFSASLEVSVAAADFEQAMAAQEILDGELARMVEGGRISGFESPASRVPYPSRRAAMDEDLREASAVIQSRREAFFETLKDLHFRLTPGLASYYDVIERAVGGPDNNRGMDWPGSGVSPVLNRHVSETEGNCRLLTLVWPSYTESSPLFETESFSGICANLRNLTLPPGAHLEVTGALSIHESIDRVLGADFFRVTWIGLAAVVFTILVLFRRADFAVLTLVPVALAVPFLFGLMNWLSIPFTVSGITLAAVILGVGIDDAAHLLTRARAGGKIGQILVEIGPVITLTTVSTMIGFGTLAGSSHPVVATMGQAICLGVLACWVFTLLVVPGAYLLVARRGRQGATLGAAALVIGFALPVHAGGGDEQVDQTLGRLKERYESVDTVSCRYRQSRSLQQLEGEIRVEGTILFQKPHFLKMEMRGDENVDLYCNGETIWIVDLDLDEVEALDADEVRTMGGRLQMIPILLFSSPEEIKSRFDVEYIEVDGRPRLRLSPLPDGEHRFQLLTVELGIQDRVRSTEVLFSNGDRVETHFRDWKRLPRVSRYTFEYRHEQ